MTIYDATGRIIEDVSSPPPVQFVWTDDWEGMYVDGELKCQGHSLLAVDVVMALGITREEREVDMKIGERLPPRLEDVKFI